MNAKAQKTRHCRRGFTILEVMIAGAVLAIGCLGVLAMLITAQGNNSVSNSRNQAIYIGDNLVNSIENEMRALLISIDSGNACNVTVDSSSYVSTDLIATILNDSLANQWTNYGPVTEIGRRWTSSLVGSTGEPSGETAHFCVGIYPRTKQCRMYSGAIRIYWRKDNGAAVNSSNACDDLYASFDTISGAKSSTAKAFEFITIPYSFVLNDERRY